MSKETWRRILGWIVTCAPLLALLLSWLAMGGKTVGAGIPQLWWLALLTLPAFAVLVVAWVKVIRGGLPPD